MRTRKLLSALAIGSMAIFGTMAAGPPDSAPTETPEEAENGCQGINQAQDQLDDQDETGAAQDALDMVEEILAGDEGCDDRRPGDAAADRPGNG